VNGQVQAKSRPGPLSATSFCLHRCHVSMRVRCHCLCLCWKIDDGDVAVDAEHERTLCQRCWNEYPDLKETRLVDIWSVGESLALAPSFVRTTTFKFLLFCHLPARTPSRAGGPNLLDSRVTLHSTAFTSSLHGTRFNPSKAEEEIKKWVETSHPSSILEGEAIGRKATN
jgi:hypothetical protein